MGIYEIYHLGKLALVIGIQQANTPEDALTKAAALDPSCVVDTTLLTLISQNGTYGVREKGDHYA